MRINGNTYTAEVNSDSQLKTHAVSLPAIAAASLKGKAFAWNVPAKDIDATDTLLCVRNDSSSENLVISKMYVWTDVKTEIDVHLITANFTAAGDTVTGVCLNKANPTTASATAKGDETGNTQGDIILTLQTNEVGTDQFAIDYNFNDSVILGTNQAIGIDIVSEPGAGSLATIIGYYIDK